MDPADYVQGLRDLADWIEANAEALDGRLYSEIGRLLIHTDDAEEMAAFVKLLGRGEKSADTNYFNVTRRFGPAVSVEVYAARDKVCERVVTGTRRVIETVRDPEMLERVPLVEREREEEIVEWKCDESILRHLPDREAVQS